LLPANAIKKVGMEGFISVSDSKEKRPIEVICDTHREREREMRGKGVRNVSRISSGRHEEQYSSMRHVARTLVLRLDGAFLGDWTATATAPTSQAEGAVS
jgi:hypothetical protein